jgi:hypothetical protein
LFIYLLFYFYYLIIWYLKFHFINDYDKDIFALYYKSIKNELIFLYHIHVTKFKEELSTLYSKYNTRFSFTFDVWTASNQNEYLEITIHYIDNAWNLNAKLIDMKHLKKRHLTKYLLKVLIECFTQYKIKNKILE